MISAERYKGVLADYLERNDEASDYGWGEETDGKREE